MNAVKRRIGLRVWSAHRRARRVSSSPLAVGARATHTGGSFCEKESGKESARDREMVIYEEEMKRNQPQVEVTVQVDCAEAVLCASASLATRGR